MQSHDQRLADALKPRERKLSTKDQSTQSFALWPRIMISHSEKPHEFNNTKRNLSQFDKCSIINANDSNSIACDIVELFCKNIEASDERTACPRISSSTTELKEDDVEMCATCKDCTECQLLQQQTKNIAAAKIRKTEEGLMSDQDKELAEHLDYYEGDIDGVETISTSSTMTASSIEHGETPILVDLTCEESKPATWKQTILKLFNDAEESSEMSGENVITSKSSVLSK